MKIWMIYKKIPCLLPMLYGFTDKKKIVKLFKEQYNRERFSIIEHEVTKEEWYKINSDQGNRILRVRGLKTSDPFGNISTIDIVMTEYDDMQLMIESDNILDYISKSLNTIQCYAHLLKNDILNQLGILWSKEIDWKEIEVDQLSLYILMNEDYLKGSNNNDII